MGKLTKMRKGRQKLNRKQKKIDRNGAEKSRDIDITRDMYT